METLQVSYETWKQATTKTPLFYVDKATGYYVFACGDQYFITAQVLTPSDISDFESNYKSQATSVSSRDDAFLKGLISNGVPLVAPRGADGNLIVSTFPADGLKRNEISMNWCDRTTWWSSAEHVTGEVATTSDPERKVWDLVHQNVIDTYHAKITGEEMLYIYRVAVSVGGVQKSEQDPHYGTGGDYTINYAEGTITFLASVPVGSDPVVSYYYENGSTWVMTPSSGEVWKLKGAECQFSEDVIIQDSLIYEVWAYNPYDLPNKILVASPDYYKSIYDYLNDANKAYPVIPALGGPGWRGTTKATNVFSWDFQTTTDLVSSYGMELRVRLEHEQEFGGTFATGTFYYIRIKE